MIRSLFAITCALTLVALPAKGEPTPSLTPIEQVEANLNCRAGTQLALRVVAFMQSKVTSSERLAARDQAYRGTVIAQDLIWSCPTAKAQRLAAGLHMAWLEWNTTTR